MLIAVNKAQPGMILSEDIILPNGGVLIKKQHALTPEILMLLKKRGINQIRVSGIDTTEKEEISLQITPNGSPGDLPVTAPNIRIYLSEDLMSANLVIEPTGQNSPEITCEDLERALSSKGIISGVDKKALNGLVEKWRVRKCFYELENVARGTPPEPAKEGTIHMLVRHLTNPSDIERTRNSHYYWEIGDSIPKVQKVTPGMLIAEKQFSKPPMPGKNLKGEAVFTEDVISAEITLAAGVSYTNNKNRIKADTQGIAFFNQGIVGIVPINFDSKIEISLSPDKMCAYLIIHPAGEGGLMPLEKEIRLLLEQNNVIFGVKNEQFQNLLQTLKRGQYPSEPYLIAEGILPQEGENGKVQFLFDTETSLVPKQNSDGSVDYKNVNIINSVGCGQKLAVLIPPSQGISGQTVTGEIVPCQDGTPAKLPIGPNTEINPQNPDTLIATVDGVVRFNGVTVEVSEGFVISGNVDFSTGNIQYEKSVIVNGDVKSGFSIECGGDLQVGGTIEDCNLSVKGNVLCKYGFIGQGKGCIDARGDINLSFLKNQTIKSRKNVNIAKEALNCTILARNSIIIHGNPLSVAGGTLTARDSIIVNTVGNHSGIKTLMEVGIDFSLVEELGKTDQQIQDFAHNYSKLVESYKKFERTVSLRKNMNARDQELYDKLTETMTRHKQQIELLEQRKSIITAKVYNLKDAYIKIGHSALPGTLFKFGDRHYLVKDEIVGPKTVRIIDHEIRII